jgi:dipeptidyl aminopeptidase/acylaminoacyl peptidase
MAAMAALAAVSTAPIATPITTRDIVEVVNLSGLAISPNGKWVAYRTDRARVPTNDYELSWFVVPIEGQSPPMRVADGGSAIVNNNSGEILPEQPIWSPDSKSIYFRARVNGVIQVWRASLRVETAIAVSHDEANVRSFALSHDGKTLSYLAGATRHAVDAAMQKQYDEGTLVDAHTDMASPVSGGLVVDGRRRLLQFNGDYFNRGELLSNFPDRQVAIDLSSGSEVTSAPPKVAPLPSRFIPIVAVAANGDRVITDRQIGRSTVTVVRKSGKRILCTVPECTSHRIQTAIWQPGDDALILSMRSANQSDSLFRWRVGAKKAEALVHSEGTLDGGRTGQPDCAISRSEMVCVEAAAASPPKIVRAAFSRSRLQTLVDPNSKLRTRIDVQVRRLSWMTGDLAFNGVLLTTGKTAAHAPLVIDYYYCDGFLRGGVGTELAMLPLAQTGIAVLCINHPPAIVGQTAIRTYQAGLEGVRQAIEILSIEGLIDPTKVGMVGFSFGSEVTNWIALHSNLLAAASISSGQIEPGAFWANALPGRNVAETYAQYFGVGWPDRDIEGWRKLSPAMTIEKLAIPMLIQAPEREARYAMEYYARALRSKKMVEFHVFADEPHILSQPAHQLASYNRQIDWFRYWLQNVEDADPNKVPQYTRWRALAAKGSQTLNRADP